MSSTLEITRFQINGQAETAAADKKDVHISLSAEGPAESMRLCLQQNGKLCWDSGILPWQPNRMLTLPLSPCSRYDAVAQLYSGDLRAESRLALYTGMMGKDWQAQWIEPEQEAPVLERPIQFFEQFVPMPDHFGGHDRLKPVQELRRQFTLHALPKQATLYATAHGVYSLWLNGRRVDARRLAPESTPYPALLYYQIYDLTALLQPGENTLTVLLADGWWIGRIGLTGDSCQYGDRLQFLAQLELEYEDHTQRIISDGNFEARPSRICYADLFMGEKWDLTLEEGVWQSCHTVDAPVNNLTAQPIAPIKPWKTLPGKLITTPKGELVADFGQCLAGVVDLKLNLSSQKTVTLDHSETLDRQGNFFRNILGRNKDQQDVLVCGPGEAAFCPEFTYHGFRYVRLDGVDAKEICSIHALALGTALENTGAFSCSDERLNQLQHNIAWSIRSNMVSVPTDCPQREKQGWTGDILAFASTGCFNYDLQGFLDAWLKQMRLEQTEDGGIPIVIPSYPAQTKMQAGTFGGNTSAAWSDACILVPLELYRFYGDKQILRDNLPMMLRWLEFIQNSTDDNNPYLWSKGYHFGDWIIPSYQDDIMGGTAVTGKVIAACQYAVTIRAFIEVLNALGEPVEPYESLLSNIQKAIWDTFIHQDGTIDGDLQGLYVMALYSGAAQGDLAQKVAAQLVRRIAENGGCLDTGFVSVPHLLDVLTEHGYKDVAWQLLYNTKSPSWLYQVVNGATTVWENWNAIRPDGTVTASSYNHYALGCVGDWIYRHIGGLHRKDAGWSHIEYAPDLNCGLTWAQCACQTPYGLAKCAWKKTGTGYEIQLTVPYGVQAQLALPGRTQALAAGEHTFTVL